MSRFHSMIFENSHAPIPDNPSPVSVPVTPTHAHYNIQPFQTASPSRKASHCKCFCVCALLSVILEDSHFSCQIQFKTLFLQEVGPCTPWSCRDKSSIPYILSASVFSSIIILGVSYQKYNVLTSWEQIQDHIYFPLPDNAWYKADTQ